MKKWTKNWTTPVRVLLAGAGIAVAAILVPMVVSAVAPSAGQVIGNQAAASYTDASNKPQTVMSNQVSTTVAQIGGITLTNDGTKTAAAGNIVYIPHDLINTGNGSDSFVIQALDSTDAGTFSNIAIYADPNSTGKGSGAPLCATPLLTGVPLCTTGFVQSVSGNQGVVHLVAAYTIPPTATTPTTPFNTATVTATPGTLSGTTIVPSTVPYSPTSVTRTDTVNLTTLAAFASTKDIKAPGVAAPGGTWPVTTGGKASSQASGCSTTWGTGLLSTPACVYTTYTISYTNTGGAAGFYSMTDTLPAGMTYVAGSAVWSGKSGTALSDTATAGNTDGVLPNTISTKFAAGKFSATVSSVQPGTNGTISFVVLVKSTAAAGTADTTNTALYSTTTCDANCATTPGTEPKTPTNPSPFPVTPTYSVIAANVATATTFDTTAGTPDKSGVDIVTVPSAFLGAKVPFVTTTPSATSNFVINKGNVTDTFNVAVDPGNFPAGTTFAFFKADGVTPLIDTNGDGKVDSGPLVAGASVEVKVVATLPGTATLLSVPYDALMTATSVGDPAVKDAVWERVDAIKSAKVDLTNTDVGNKTSTDGGATTTDCVTGSNCDLGQGPSNNPTFTTSTTPAKAAEFPLFIKNQEPGATTYDLTASVPPGWTVKFVGSTDSCVTGTAITTTPSIASNGQLAVKTCVTPPAGTSPGTTPVQITATKTGDTTVTDTITDAVKVTAPIVPSMQLGPVDVTNTTPTGGTTSQPETLTNTGTASCGAGAGFNVALSFDAAAKAAGWTAVVFYDTNANGVFDALEPTIAYTDVANTTANFTSSLVAGVKAPLTVGSSLQLLVKTFAPTNAVEGASATATLTVTDLNTTVPSAAAPQICPAQTARIATKVTNGTLSVVKSQFVKAGTGTAPSKLCSGLAPTDLSLFVQTAQPVVPGDCVIYQVVATNTGSAAVTNVVLSDAVPAYTVYNATQPTSQCVGTTATGVVGTPVVTTTGPAVSCGSATGITLNSQGSMTMYYAVQVQQ